MLSCKVCFQPVSLFSVPDLEIKGQAVEDQLLTTSPPDLLSAGDGASHTLPTISANRGQLDTTAAPEPARIPPSETRKPFKQNGRLYCTSCYLFFIWRPFLSFVCNWNIRHYFLSLRLWRGFDWLRGQFQFSKPPRLLPPQLAVCVGDPSAAPLPAPDPRVLSDCRGAVSLSVRLAWGAGADRTELCGHQVGGSDTSRAFVSFHTTASSLSGVIFILQCLSFKSFCCKETLNLALHIFGCLVAVTLTVTLEKNNKNAYRFNAITLYYLIQVL